MKKAACANQANENITDVMQGTGNPFLDALAPFISTDGLLQRLATSPLTGIDITQLNKQQQLDLLDRIQEEYFEPITMSIDATSRLLRLIRKGIINRDPTKPAVRQQTMEIAAFSGKELKHLPWYSVYAHGMTLVGVTGLGKSFEIKRALSFIPQCIEHSSNSKAGWVKMKQISWLYVAMSHDGSLGGLMLQILYAIDEVLGTQYSADRSLTAASNEKLAVRLAVIFRNHGLGVLVIDELQTRNFEGRGLGRFVATFFLRLLNMGIPVVLIGNPLGLSSLYNFSQDCRRIGSGGSLELHPLEKNGFDWSNCVVDSLIKQSVMPEPARITNPHQAYFKYSGGIREYANRIHVCSQRLALDLGNRFITEEHMEQAFNGPDFSNKDRDLIAGFRDKDPKLLIQFEDIPWEDYAKKWGLRLVGNTFHEITEGADKSDKEITASEESMPSSPQAKSIPEKLLAKIKQQRTRQENAEKKRAATKKSLDQRDMRVEGLSNHLISEMNLVC